MSFIGGLKTAGKGMITIPALMSVAGVITAKKVTDTMTPLVESHQKAIIGATESRMVLGNLGLDTPNVSNKYEDPDFQLSNEVRRMLTSFIEVVDGNYVLSSENLHFIEKFCRCNSIELGCRNKPDESGNFILDANTVFSVEKRKKGILCLSHKYRFTTDCGGTKKHPCFYRVK